MTLADILYDLGDAIGWDRCDYARDQDGTPYGIAGEHATIALALGEDTLYWDISVPTEYGLDPIDHGLCPASEAVEVLLPAWEQACELAIGETEI